MIANARPALVYRPHGRGRARFLQRAGAPAALGLLAIPAIAAFAASDPLVLAAAGAAVVALGLASGAGPALRFAARYGLALGVLMVAVNVLVSQRGDTVLVRGFDLPVLGPIVVTLESMGEGATIAARVVVVVAAFAVATACVDPNEVLRLARPIARRSAMTAALIGRLAPVAAQDAARLGEAARLRGPAAAPVGRAALARRLVAGSLDRSLEVAATLELRGYSLGGRGSAIVRAGAGRPGALRVTGLGYRYPGTDRPALDGVDLEIRPGEAVLLAGPSGSGKTTLLHAACGLVPHFHGGEIEGRVEVAGMDTREHGPGELAAGAGLVAQDPEAQVVSTTVRAELALPLEMRGAPAAERDHAVAEAACELGIEGLLERTTDTLSGGELQRVALAAALITGPALVLLDEPTSQLDPEGVGELISLLRRLSAERGTAIVLAEHRVERCLDAVDRVVALAGGRVVFDGSPGEYVATLPREPVTPGSMEPDAGADRPLNLRDATVELDAGEGPLEVLRDVNLELRAGELVALAGPNGAGKSTLLRACAGLVPLASGALSVPRGCALLTQSPADFLVRERAGDELPGPEGLRALRVAGLEWAADRDPRDLSGGERQRLALAIVLAGRENGGLPGVVCLDEPTRGMDSARKGELAERLRVMAAAGAAVLVATHDEAFARSFCGRTVRIRDGRVAEAVPA